MNQKLEVPKKHFFQSSEWDENQECRSLGFKKNKNTFWLTIEGFTRNDPAFANSIGVWRNFSEPWDMAENGFKLIKGMGEKYGM